MLQKGVYPHKYINNWQRFNETLPGEKDFYSNLTMEAVTNADYKHGKRVWEDFRMQNLDEYYDLYVQSNTLLLADTSESFCNRCIQIYELSPAHFFSATGSAWQAYLKKTQVELRLLTDVDIMQLIVEKDKVECAMRFSNVSK